MTYTGMHPGFQVRGVHLKKLRRSEGVAKMFGVFRLKNNDFTPKHHIFSNFRGGGCACRLHPPRSAHATQWPHLVKHLRMCEIVRWKKTHVINKNIDGSYAKATQKRIQQALSKNKKKRCCTDLLHFSTRKHNLVSFFGWILFWQNCIVVVYIFFFFRRKC